jgi:hypothetical protein
MYHVAIKNAKKMSNEAFELERIYQELSIDSKAYLK